MIPRKLLTITRAGTGSYTNGLWVDGAPVVFTLRGSVQPATAKQMLSLPEGRRQSSAYMIYTSTLLRTVEGGRQPDRLTIGGAVYEVVNVAEWQNQVISHYEAMAVKVNDGN